MIDDPILAHLNEKQLMAVSAPRRPLLMLAGPGTGKTLTLINRIIYNLKYFKIPPDQILALTFSNKAAAEIKQRLYTVIPDKADKIRCSTFHSFCLDILRKYPEDAGLNKHFVICDEEYQRRLLHNLLKSRMRDDPQKKIKGILLAFSNYLLKEKPLPAFSAGVYDEYTAHLQKHRLVDFDQMLTKTLSLFKEHKDILEQYRFLNSAIMVDEFQDTDPIQYEIVRLLARKHGNIFVVADDDQSIYAWRGANPDNIRKYIQDFSISGPVFLEQNYRCGEKIMKTAANLIKDTDRVEPDKIINGNPNEDAVLKAIFFKNEREEIDFIIKKIKHWQKNDVVANSDIALIYPRHIFGDRVSDYLLKERIPFQQAAGRNLSEHLVMKKILLYLKLIRDPSDNLIVEELVEAELGYHIYKQIQSIGGLNKISFRKALYLTANQMEVSYNLRNQLNTFIGNISNLFNLKSFFNFEQLVQEIIQGIQNLNPAALQKYVTKFKPLYFEQKSIKSKTGIRIWVYHPDEKIQFLAVQLLKNCFDVDVIPLTREKIIHLESKDLVLLLGTLDTVELPCPYITLFKEKSEHRQGMLTILFRWIQTQLKGNNSAFDNYVVFDLETTGKNPDLCGIVEIAAVRVAGGKITESFQSLVNPGMPIEPEASAVHQITEADLKDKPSISQIWKEFKEFIGNDLLIAHNGFAFDFKILDRAAKEIRESRLQNLRYDSLILARNLFQGQQNSIDALAARFKLKAGTRHRALDDAKVLHDIFQKLLAIQERNETNGLAEDLCEFSALGNVLENTIAATEDKILFQSGIKKLISPYSAVRHKYCKQFAVDNEELQQNLIRIASRVSPASAAYNTDEDFFRRVMQTASEFSRSQVDLAIPEFLSYVSLINPQDSLDKIDAVSLLTFHAAKGLEFDKVIILGMEDEQMPSFFAYRNDDQDDRTISKKIEEQKRLLYVGITRGKNEIIFTIVKNRNGRKQKSSPFLEQIRSTIDIESLSEHSLL